MKTYRTEPGAKQGTVNVTCPNRDCGGKFVVSRSWLQGWRHYMTASCPYCFQTANRR